MKLHVDTDNKTVAIEGTVEVHKVFSYLMSWFPEEWEQWKFIQFTPVIQYKEVVVYKDVYRQPYWNPFRYDSPINSLVDATFRSTSNTLNTDSQLTINFQD
mgnify:FL=1